MSTTEVAPDSPIEVLESSVTPVVIVLPSDEEAGWDELTFVQKELTFFGKIDFFAVMANALEKAMQGGVSVVDLLDIPDLEEGKQLSAEAIADAESFVGAIAKLVAFAPTLFLDLYCVMLSVPREEREEVKPRLEQQLTDAQGFQILETFFDQNWEVMTSFFSERIAPLVRKVGAKVQPSAPSKPSKRTRRTTQKASQS